MSEKKQLGKILLRQRALSPEELDRALAENWGKISDMSNAQEFSMGGEASMKLFQSS